MAEAGMPETVVGAFARVDLARRAAVRRQLAALRGVEPFDLDDAAKIGIVIEAASLDAAHDVLARVIPSVDGILGVWPVSVHHEPGEPQTSQIREGTGVPADAKEMSDGRDPA